VKKGDKMERKSVAMFVLALLLSSSLFGCISPEEKPTARIEEDVIKQILNAPDTISISNPVETTQYDLANNHLLAVTNSALEVSKYWVANDPDAVIIDDSWKTILKIDGDIVQNPTNIFARSGTFTCEYDDPNWKYPLTKWWEHSLESGWLTPVEYYQPEFPHGGLRQAWSSMPAAAMILGGFGFWPGLYETTHIKSPAWGDSEINGIKYRGHSYDIIVRDGVVTLYEDGKKIQTGASTATIKV
jgi:hypothetical protein